MIRSTWIPTGTQTSTDSTASDTSSCDNHPTATSIICVEKDEEEIPTEEEPFPLPSNVEIKLIRDYFKIGREPP